MSRFVVDCETLKQIGIPVKCCGSCHDEEEGGYSYLCGLDVPEELDSLIRADETVCCATAGIELTPEHWEALKNLATA